MEHPKEDKIFLHPENALMAPDKQRMQIGLFAWLMQRISALALVALAVLHLVYPYKVELQTLTAFFLCLHAALGIRVIILDIGKRVVLHRILFAALMLLGLIAFAVILKYRILYL